MSDMPNETEVDNEADALEGDITDAEDGQYVDEPNGDLPPDEDAPTEDGQL